MHLNYKIIEIIEKLESNGYETYIVGGACRDEILDKPASDIDIVTTASLEEIKQCFPNEVFVEYQKGLTVAIIYNKSLIDISTTNNKTIEEDVYRRDFTINSILYHPKRGWVDIVNGRKDILDKTIKSVSSPKEMILADPLRILRAIRFEAVLNFKIDNELLKAMLLYKDELKKVAKERIKDELNKILLVPTPSIYIEKYIEIFDLIIPGLLKCKGFDQRNNWHIYDVLTHILKVVDYTRPILILRLAALFHDIEKPNTFTIDEKGVGHFYGHYHESAIKAKKVLKGLRYPLKDIDRIYNIIEHHDVRLELNDKQLLKFIAKFGIEDIDLLFALKQADNLAQNPIYKDVFSKLDEIYSRIKYLIESKKYITKEMLNIKGSDLIEIGFPLDKSISNAINNILEEVREGNLVNEKDVLIEYAKTLLLF